MITLDIFKEYVEIRDQMDSVLITERRDTSNLLSAQDEGAKRWRSLLFIAQTLENDVLGKPDFLISE